jgi:hypothetical protein
MKSRGSQTRRDSDEHLSDKLSKCEDLSLARFVALDRNGIVVTALQRYNVRRYARLIQLLQTP